MSFCGTLFIFFVIILSVSCSSAQNKGEKNSDILVTDSLGYNEVIVLANDSQSANKEMIFGPVEIMAEFPGGEDSMLKFIYNNFRYPGQMDIEGTIYLEFKVDTLGQISNAKILKPLHPAYDREALRVVNKMPGWVPGSMYGKKISQDWVLPIKIPIQEKY